MKKKIVKIKEIYIDEELYPREKLLQTAIHEYAFKMREGEVFPAIWLADYKGKLYLVDGRHRLEAFLENGEEYIQAEIQSNFKNKEDIFLASVKANLKHGTRLKQKDKIKIVYKLNDLKVAIEDISKLLGLNQHYLSSKLRSKISTSVLKQAVRVGKIKQTLREHIPKRENIKLVDDKEVEEIIENNKDKINTIQLDNFIEFLQTEKLDVDENDEYRKKIRKIKKLLNKKYPNII